MKYYLKYLVVLIILQSLGVQRKGLPRCSYNGELHLLSLHKMFQTCRFPHVVFLHRLTCVLKSLKPSQGQFGRDQYELWTLPPALTNIAPGRYLTCPSELIQCQRITTYKRPICAISSDLKNVERKNFSTICDMRYTNCKLNKQYWGYLKDDDGKC